MITSDSGSRGPIAPAGAAEPTKADRRTARAAAGRYHEAELQRLVERVRDGLARYDAGEIDAFELDDLIHHYK
ncbi:MAG: hypothetical protein LC790_03395 [Actinobacteria bacterium]|nr:hypothetical protein [Actinomycetota bacterium]